jgi:hypothetical protein
MASTNIHGIGTFVGSLFTDPRRFVPCARCHDIGMVEDDRCEDVCPECEGGVWREREPWRRFFTRVRLPLGLRFKVWRWPFFYTDFPA